MIITKPRSLRENLQRHLPTPAKDRQVTSEASASPLTFEDVVKNIRQQVRESVATTYYHDYYGSRTGINNRIPVCPNCRLPVLEGDKAGVGPERCKCEINKHLDADK